MTAIPITSTSPAVPVSTTSTNGTAGAAGGATGTNQINENTFLQLLVAQMKYQDPLSPTDSTQFLTQTAQFTEVSTLQQIEADQQAIQHTNQLLAASGMVGRGVTYATTGIAPATAVATGTVTVGGNLAQDAPVGAHVTLDTTAYNNIGTSVPLQLQFTRTANGWSMQASTNGQAIGSPSDVTFDATGQRTSADITLAASDLDTVTGTTGTWPPAGMTINLGAANDPNRLEMGAGASNAAVLQQDGGDGHTLTGIVTGIHVTSAGPQLEIDGRDVPLSSVTEVQAPAL
jgi:flagellar basal-body rod modification protein FlgD